MHQPEQSRSAIDDVRTAANVMTGFCRSLATTVEVFLRSGFGSRYLGLQAAAGIVLIPFFSIFWPHEDCRPLLWFLLAYLGMSGVARLGTLRSRGYQAHSRYNGSPRLRRLLPWMAEERIKGQAEPVLVFLTGALILPLSLPLGSYLMLAALALLVSVSMVDAYGKERAQQLYDSMLEQEELMRRLRCLRGD